MKKFDPVFEDGLVLCEAPGHRSRLEVSKVAEVSVSSELVVVDALEPARAKSPRVPVQGTFSVFVSRVRWLDENQQRDAFAWVELSKEAVTKWKKLGDVPIDSGLVSFREASRGPAEDGFDGGTEAGLVAVASGWGDGRYRCFLGTDASGAPARVLVDFEVAHRETWLSVEWPLPVKTDQLQHARLLEDGVQLEVMDRWKSKPLVRAREVALEWQWPSAKGVSSSLDFVLIGPEGAALPVQREVIDDTRSTSSVRMLMLRTDVDRPAGAVLRMRMLESKTPLLP